MLEPLRRIVAATTEKGIGNIISDKQLEQRPLALVPDAHTSSIWVTLDALPTKDNNRSEDGGTRAISPSENFGLVPSLGTNLQSTELPPGAATPMHRTSSLDYNILIEGEVVLIMEDGTEKHLKNPGDTVVMKGGTHAWRNPSTVKPTRWISLLMSAEPVMVDSVALDPEFK